MSAKKTVRHIQNNFRLTTKLLSDSNILPVSKVLLKNNFPTYELPLQNPNSRPKRKKTNTDCPPCPPAKDTDCPEPENNYAGQTSYLHPRSKYYPRSKWEPKEDYKSKLTDADKEYLTHDLSKDEDALRRAEFLMEFGGEEALEEDDEIKAIVHANDLTRVARAKDVKVISIDKKYNDYLNRKNEYGEDKDDFEVTPEKMQLLTDFFSKIESGQLSKPKDNQEYSQTKKYSFGNPRKTSQSKRHIPTFKSSDIFGQQELEESAYIDDDGNYIPEKKKFNSLTEYRSECEYVDKKSLFKQMDEQFHQSNEEELTYRLFQHQFEYFDLNEIDRYQGIFGMKELIEPRKQYLKGYEYVSEYNTNIKYKEIGADLLPKKDNAYYRLYTNCKNFIVERFYKIGSTENKNEFTHPLPIDKYFEIINPVDKASSNSTENQSYSIAFDLGKKSAIAKLPQDHKRDPKWNQLLKEVADRIRDQRINKPLHEVLPVLIKNWNDGWINQKNELDRVAGKVSSVEFDTIEFSDLLRKKLISSGYKIVNKEVNNLFEITYNLKSEKFLKEIQESFELALVKHCRQIFFEKIIDLKYEKRKEIANDLHKKIFDRILEAYNNQPVLNVRTSTSVKNQAYSTPIPLGFLISFYLGLYEQENRSVYEPCAGNGSLLIAAHLDNVTANEIDPVRIRHLESHGFRVEPGDALDVVPNRKFARLVMNPPFGVYPANKHIKLNGKAITQIDQAIAINSLKYLEPNGIAAIILGGHTLTKDKFGGYKSTDQFFHNHLYRNYDVLKCIDINGDIYRKQGTSFDIRLIILRNSNTPEYRHILPYEYGDKPGQILKANTWDELYEFMKEQYSFKTFFKVGDYVDYHNDNSGLDEVGFVLDIEGESIWTKRGKEFLKIPFKKILSVKLKKEDLKEGLDRYWENSKEQFTQFISGIKKGNEPSNKDKINKSATTHEDKIISSINDIPKLVRQFMPLHQQKAVASFKSNEHVKVLDDLEKQILNTPQTYETEDIDTPEKILHLHYFYGNSDWYISEKDSNEKQDQAFGFVILNGDIDNAEWGYISIEELKNTNKVELDFYWTPIKFKELNKIKGESNEQQNNQSYTSNSSEASGELDSQRQRERIQANERDFGDRRNQRQRIENNKNNDSKRDRRPDTQHETDGHRARRDDSNPERIGVSGGLDSPDTQDSVIDEEKFRKFAEFLKKAGL